MRCYRERIDIVLDKLMLDCEIDSCGNNAARGECWRYLLALLALLAASTLFGEWLLARRPGVGSRTEQGSVACRV